MIKMTVFYPNDPGCHYDIDYYCNRPHAGTILADIPNYTNVRPQVQFSEVKLAAEPVLR